MGEADPTHPQRHKGLTTASEDSLLGPGRRTTTSGDGGDDGNGKGHEGNETEDERTNETKGLDETRRDKDDAALNDSQGCARGPPQTDTDGHRRRGGGKAEHIVWEPPTDRHAHRAGHRAEGQASGRRKQGGRDGQGSRRSHSK